VGGGQHRLGGFARLQRFLPARGAQAPAAHEPRRFVIGARG
jgi:hypothetical protein